MYSRFSRNGDRAIRIPEHYSGCAFSEIAASAPPPREEPLPPPSAPAHTAESHGEKQAPPKEADRPALLPLSLSIGNHLPFLGGSLGSEELLLIGLILLLARSEQDNDLILWLVLLLFCRGDA